MSRLFVGQRVKLIAGVDAGNTGVIEHFSDEKAPWTVAVRFDNPGLDMAGQITAAGEISLCRPSYLVPILPSGQVAVTLEQLLSVPGLESLDKILGVKA